MDLIAAIRHRRATRACTTTPVAIDTLRSLTARAVAAPGTITRQPWLFAVVRGRATLRRIAEAMPDCLLGRLETGSPVPRFREVLQDRTRDLLCGAPALIVICATATARQAAEDCAPAAFGRRPRELRWVDAPG